MLTNEDIQKLIEVMATKEDVKDLKEDMTALRESVQALAVSIDKLAKAVEDLHQEYVAISSKIDRHEKWIQRLADKLNIKLEY
jgi:predicted  nucleic acid-binding Zn-ribbon protein